MTTTQLITAITIPSSLVIVSIINDQVRFRRLTRRLDGMVLQLDGMLDQMEADAGRLPSQSAGL